MLDQNTDRMWYVIGALVVGAGIILLANKMMPEVFANVTGTFEGITNNTLDDIGTQGTKVFKRNLILNPNKISVLANLPGRGEAELMTDENQLYYRVTPNADEMVSTYWLDIYGDEGIFYEEMIPGKKYTASVDVRIPVAGDVSFFKQQGRQEVKVINEWVTISHTYTYDPEDERYFGGRIIGNNYNRVGQYMDYKNWKVVEADE